MKTNHPTHETFFTRRRFSWSRAVSVALALAAAPCARAATDAANAAALRTNLPAGITLKRATIKQTADALHETVVQHHDDAVDLLRIAILVKMPKQWEGKLSCEDLRRLAQAAVTAAPDKASQLVDLAATFETDCADSLQTLLTSAEALGDLGAGFGPGFPGSPGFVGSPPSGSVALPNPSPTPVTPTTSD